MADFLQSTARRVILQAYLSSDHVTPATGKTIPVQISKNGGAYGNPNAGATNATEIANGSYYVDLDTTDTGTLGPLIVRGTEGTIDPIVSINQVILAVPVVNLTQIGGDTQSATDLKDFADAGYDPATNKVQGVVLTDTVTTYTGNTPQTGDTYALANGSSGFVAIKGDTVDIETDTQDIQSRLPAALVSGRIDASVGAMGANTLTASALATDAVAEIQSGLMLAASYTAPDNASIADILVDTGTTIPASLTAIDGKIDTLDTNLDALIADIGANGSGLSAVPWNSAWDTEVESEVTDALTAFDVVTNTDLDALPTAVENADALLDRADAIGTGLTLRKILRGMSAALLGKISGAGTSTIVIRDVNDSKNVVTATVDENGNRSSVTTDLT